MMNPSVLIGGQLLGAAFACGLNLYATVALLGIAGRLDWLTELPPGMRGLENGLVIGAAAALFLIEFIIDRIPVLDTVWEALHTVIRPGAAALLAVLALQGTPWYVLAGGAAAAFVMALSAHGTKAGIRLILANRRAAAPHGQQRRHAVLRTAASMVEDIAAVAIVLTALLVPHAAGPILAASVGLLLLAGPRLWRAAFLGMYAMTARLRGFFGVRGWRSREQIPRYLRSAVPQAAVGTGPARALRATLTGMAGIGAYRHGWIVVTRDRPRFVYRTLFRTRSAELPAAATIRHRAGFLTDTLDVQYNGGGQPRGFTLYLLKDGPSPAAAADELGASAP
jgi:hypothetical protein